MKGLYARLRALEQWKESTSRIQWIIIIEYFGVTYGKMFWDA